MTNEYTKAVASALKPLTMLNIKQQQTKIAVLNVNDITAPDDTEPGHIDIIMRYVVLHNNGNMSLIDGGLSVAMDSGSPTTTKDAHDNLVAHFVKQIQISLKLIASQVRDNAVDVNAIKQYDIETHFNNYLVDRDDA